MSTNEEASRLRDLQADVRDQDDLERDITRQVGPSSQLSITLSSHLSLFRPIKLWQIKQKRMTSSDLRKPLWIGSKSACPGI